MNTEEMLAKATPRPWLMSRDEEGDTHFIARHGWGGGGPNYYSDVDYPQDEADGLLVITAVNNFERLRDALRNLERIIAPLRVTADYPGIGKALEDARAALEATDAAN